MSSAEDKLRALRNLQKDRRRGSNASSKGESSLMQEKRNDNNENEQGQFDNMGIMKERIRKRDLRSRKTNEMQPELNIIGEITGATGLNTQNGACVRFSVEHGNMILLGGDLSGQSHIDYPSGDEFVWGQPLDVHLSCSGIDSWPRILLQCWEMDEHGRLELVGYGFSHFPSVAGCHTMQVQLWRPLGMFQEEVRGALLGGKPQLRDTSILFDRAWSDRCRLNTTAAGTVTIDVDIVMRNWKVHQVDL